MIITNEFDLSASLIELKKATTLCFDIETAADHDDELGNALSPHHGHVVGFSLKGDAGQTYYYPIAHRNSDGTISTENFPQAVEMCRELFETKKVICHNAKFEYKYMKYHYDIDLNLYFDTYVAHKLMNEHGDHSLKGLGQKILNLGDWSMPWNDHDDHSMISIKLMGEYCNMDVDVTYELFLIFSQAINDNFHYVFHECEMPAIVVSAEMELEGVLVDEEKMIRVSQQVMKDLAATTFNIHKMGGKKINPKSADQRAELLFDHLQIPYTYESKELDNNGNWITKTKEFQRTATGKRKADKIILPIIKDRHPIVPEFIKHSQLSTLLAGYVGYVNDPKTGRLHPSFNQLGTDTGRYSSSGPNFQQVPARDKYGIRECFIARPGYVLIDADYSAQELKVLTALTGDPTLLRIDREGLDPHGFVAVNLVFKEQLKGVNPNDVKKLHPDLRDRAKPVMFAIVYGAAAPKIAEMLGLTKEEGQAVIDEFNILFPKVANLIKSTHEFVKNAKYSQNIDGRRRRYKYHNMSTEDAKGVDRLWVKLQKERNEAANFQIQGVSATMTKQAMVDYRKALLDRGMKTKILCCVHDEIIAEAPKEEAEKAARLLEECMVNVDVCRLWGNITPMKAEAQIGSNWGSIK